VRETKDVGPRRVQGGGGVIRVGLPWLTMALALATSSACREPSSAGIVDEQTFASGMLHDDLETRDGTAQTVTTTPPERSLLPRTDEQTAERHRMVDSQIASRGVRDARVLAALKNVPRHWFVQPQYLDQAYADRPLPIGHDQTISQPYIVGLMTELLALGSGDKVLEIGTGSGYQAAVLAELVDQVFTIEIVEPLARRTIDLLAEKGYRTIHTRIGDGYQGWPGEAPFDAIIVTCAPDDVPRPLIEQLATGGRLCIPVGSARTGQELILLSKLPDGTLERRFVIPVRFVPMTGRAQDG